MIDNTVTVVIRERYRQIFIETGVRVDISLPRQHSLVHYIPSIRLFGSPNGLCSSITESKHIKAVKEPWRRSSRNHPLPQMLRTLTRLDKLSAARSVFTQRGMMTGTAASYTAMTEGEQGDDADDDEGIVHGPRSLSDIELAVTPQRGYPKFLDDLALHIGHPTFPLLFRRFLYAEVHGPPGDNELPPSLDNCPVFEGRISVHHSAVARFYAPSDLCGAGGMYREHIRSTPSWHGYPRRDTVLVDVGGAAMKGLIVARALLLFSFEFSGVDYECALVHWFVPVGEEPDPDTGLWVVEPEMEGGSKSLQVISLKSIARASHLLPVYGREPLPEDFHFAYSLDAFDIYFVNRYADHHMHEFLS
ncbi:hypothetical protein R3P38DRAFT_3408214 [Favolaschia claudopus]|uniref:Uncharacterized protein n=1 Tax=Favolaschia claudopus TaxID=2862362 RepID=A0AAV9ZVE2_9AGAR